MSDKYDKIVRIVKLARGLEMGGFYNAAKLMWASAYSQELRDSNVAGVPTLPTDLSAELVNVIADFKSDGANPQLIDALERGMRAVKDNATIPASDIPEVHVCRTCGEIVLGTAPEACPNCGAWELTFRTFPAVYYLEPLPPDQALASLESSPELVLSLVRRLNEDQMLRQPKVGEWSIREVLVHLLMAQDLLAGRVTRMLAQDNPSLKAMNAWNLDELAETTSRALVDSFRESRDKTVAELKAAAPLGWWRTGEHEEFGSVTVLQQASYFAKHDHNHLTQIRQVLKAIGA
jgi:uncharacterized damage-inducible protein DinB